MDIPYHTLLSLYRIIEKESRPQSYQFTPRELILRMAQDWQQTQSDLQQLAEEGLVICRIAGSYIFSLTEAGIEKARFMAGPLQEY